MCIKRPPFTHRKLAPKMLSIFKLVTLLLSSQIVSAGKSCRQCIGTQDVIFTDYVTSSRALDYGLASVLNCDSEREGLSLKCSGIDCQDPSRCKRWLIQYHFWRYCGNGGSVNLAKHNLVLAGVAAVTDTLSLSCHPSVYCGRFGCSGRCS